MEPCGKPAGDLRTLRTVSAPTCGRIATAWPLREKTDPPLPQDGPGDPSLPTATPLGPSFSSSVSVVPSRAAPSPGRCRPQHRSCHLAAAGIPRSRRRSPGCGRFPLVLDLLEQSLETRKDAATRCHGIKRDTQHLLHTVILQVDEPFAVLRVRVDGPRLLSTGAAARIAGCSPVTILRAIDAGQLTALRLGAHGQYDVSARALEHWLQPIQDGQDQRGNRVPAEREASQRVAGLGLLGPATRRFRASDAGRHCGATSVPRAARISRSASGHFECTPAGHPERAAPTAPGN